MTLNPSIYISWYTIVCSCHLPFLVASCLMIDTTETHQVPKETSYPLILPLMLMELLPHYQVTYTLVMVLYWNNTMDWMLIPTPLYCNYFP